MVSVVVRWLLHPMRGAAVSRHVGYGLPARHFAGCGYSESWRRGHALGGPARFGGPMHSSHIIRGKDRHERRRRRSLLHVWTAVGFFAFHQAHHADDFESELARGFNRLNRRSSSGANVIHDYHSRAVFAKAFDPLTGSVLLLALPDQKAVDLSAGYGYRHDNRVGTHGHAANGLGPPFLLFDLL